ncbi:unnamed protein product [Rangifer tarandus platyrhynchus]|uniref:Uncharacterized protein n=1 Tax=Rangifer tarandus platyrhynchus TaxID=3082113 RepID=A0ACB1KFG3_RANTA
MCPTSTRDNARFNCIDSRAIPRTPLNTTSGLTSFRQLERCPENTVPSLEEYELQHSNSRNAPCTPNRFETPPEMPREHCPKTRGTPTSAQQLEECPVYHKSSRDES